MISTLYKVAEKSYLSPVSCNIIYLLAERLLTRTLWIRNLFGILASMGLGNVSRNRFSFLISLIVTHTCRMASSAIITFWTGPSSI